MRTDLIQTYFCVALLMVASRAESKTQPVGIFTGVVRLHVLQEKTLRLLVLQFSR